MKRATICWAAAGIVLGLLTLFLLGYGINSSPALLVDPADLSEAAEQVMTCAVSGDFETLSSLLYGAPDLGKAPAEAESAEGMIWHAFLSSIQFEFSDTCYLLDSHVALDMVVTCLDISAVTDTLQESAPRLLVEKAEALGDESAIYDDSHNYRKDFLAEVMQEATAQALAGRPRTLNRELTLEFIRVRDRWQVVPTGELLQLLSGFVAD